MHGLERQRRIYLKGVSGQRPRVPTDATQLEERAESAMSAEAFAYIAGGAGSGATMRANRAAFDRWRILPRMLRDVETRDTPSSSSAARSRSRSSSRRSACRRWSTRTPTSPPPGPRRPRASRWCSPTRPPSRWRTCARGDGRLAALVPAVLEQAQRPRGELRPARRGVRLRGDRHHARHDAARLAHARPRPRLPAVPAGQGHRAVRQRPGVQPHRRRARGRPRRGDARRAAQADAVGGHDAALPEARRASAASRSSASSTSTRARR